MVQSLYGATFRAYFTLWQFFNSKKKIFANDEKIKISIKEPDSTVKDQQAMVLDIVTQLETMKNKSEEKINKGTGLTKTRKYNRKHMEAAVEMYLAGRPMSQVIQRFPMLHQRTIRRRVLRVQRGEVDRRRGPRPLLEGEAEQTLVAWVLSMQSRGTKVTKKDILAKANEQYRALTGEEAGENRLKEGWLRRFKDRHPVLSGRVPVCVRQEDNSSAEEDRCPSFSSEGDKLSNQTQSQEIKLSPETEEKSGFQLKRLNAVGGRTEDNVAAPKRQKIADKAPITTSESTCQDSILPERQQSGTVGNVQKLDAIMQSNERLEQMQRQQLEMLQQLSSSNKMQRP